MQNSFVSKTKEIDYFDVAPSILVWFTYLYSVHSALNKNAGYAFLLLKDSTE